MEEWCQIYVESKPCCAIEFQKNLHLLRPAYCFCHLPIIWGLVVSVLFFLRTFLAVFPCCSLFKFLFASWLSCFLACCFFAAFVMLGLMFNLYLSSCAICEMRTLVAFFSLHPFLAVVLPKLLFCCCMHCAAPVLTPNSSKCSKNWQSQGFRRHVLRIPSESGVLSSPIKAAATSYPEKACCKRARFSTGTRF